MPLTLRKSILTLSIVLVGSMSALGGPNKNARILVDYNADTREPDTACIDNGMQKTVHMAVHIDNAADLTGFMMHVVFDSAALKFEDAQAAEPGGIAKPFLETKGGIPDPFMVKASSAQAVDIASGVKSVKGAAVSGSGLLAYLTFSRTGRQDRPDTDCTCGYAGENGTASCTERG